MKKNEAGNEGSNAGRAEQQFILNGDLWKIMIRLSWPAIIAMVLYGLNSVIAAVFVGRYIVETALAGVSVAYPLTQISTGIGSLIGVGAGAVLSIAIGGKDKAKQVRLLGHVNSLSLVSTVIYMIGGLLFSGRLIQLMGGEEEALLLGERYFSITVLGAFFWIYGLATNMIVRAEGKMKAAALVMGIGLAAADAAFLDRVDGYPAICYGFNDAGSSVCAGSVALFPAVYGDFAAVVGNFYGDDVFPVD